MLDRPLEHNSAAAIYFHSYIFRNPPPPSSSSSSSYGTNPPIALHRVVRIHYKKSPNVFAVPHSIFHMRMDIIGKHSVNRPPAPAPALPLKHVPAV